MKKGDEFYNIFIDGLVKHIVHYEVDHTGGDVVYLKTREILKIIGISPRIFNKDRADEENNVAKKRSEVERYMKEDEKKRRQIIELILN